MNERTDTASRRLRSISPVAPLVPTVLFLLVALGIVATRPEIAGRATALLALALLLALLSLGVALAFMGWHARHAASERLARSAAIAESQHALDSVTDGVIVYDSNWRFIFLNRSAALVALKPREELIGQVLWDLYPELVGGTIHRNYQEAQKDQQPRSFEIHYEPTGQWLELRVFPTADRTTVVLRDVSAQHAALAQLEYANQGIARQLRRAEEMADSLRHSNKQLDERNRQLQEFTHIASHDLQEPLRKIRIFGDMLREQSPSLGEPGDDYLRRMLAATTRMQSLISSLLAFARVDNGVPERVTVDLAQVVADALGDLINDSGGPAPVVTIDPLPRVLGDPVLLRQAMLNLLANAAKFVKPGELPRVEIGCEIFRPIDGLREWCRISVRDQGIGFDPAESERIFDLFRRLHGRASYEGSGIGLAIVRRIVEFHGGRVRAHGALGAGACFEVELPLLPEAPAPSHPPEQECRR